MKKVIMLLIVLGALIGVALVTRDTSENRLKPAAAREKLLPDLDVNAVRKIRLKEGDKTVTLAITGSEWTVAERSNFPAAFEKIAKTLVELKDQKTGKQRTLGQGAWGDLQLNEPGKGTAEESGLLVELLGENDKALATLVLGKNITSSTVGKEASPFGGGGNERYVRVKDDGTAVWVVDNQFYEMQTRPEDWVEKSFIDVARIKEVEITTPKAEDNWKAARKDESSTDFALADGKPGEELDNGKAPLSGVLSSPSFTDVVTKDKATADFMKDAWTAKISTFDGLMYTLKLLKKGSGSDEKHYLSVAVNGNFPKTRPPVKDEKPDDAKKNDEAFTETTKRLEEKLAKEKKTEGWIYEISGYTVTSLLKKRGEILKDKNTAPAPAAEAGNPAGSAPSVPGLPTSMFPKPPAAPAASAPTPAPAPAPPAEAPKAPVSVTTPPVAVPSSAPPAPAVPKPEVKAPAPDPLPTTPAAPAPAPAKPEEPKK